MQTVLIVIHLMVVLALVGVVLLQRSEGGGLGIGGGSGFMTARGAANALTRSTAILATAFFITSLALSLLARYGSKPTDILERVPAIQTEQGAGGVLNQLGGKDIPTQDGAAPAADKPAAAAPATDAPALAPAAQVPAAATPTVDVPAATTPATDIPAPDASAPVPGAAMPITPEAPASSTGTPSAPAAPAN
jgi:preprotein translocase subunit SecG